MKFLILFKLPFPEGCIGMIKTIERDIWRLSEKFLANARIHLNPGAGKGAGKDR